MIFDVNKSFIIISNWQKFDLYIIFYIFYISLVFLFNLLYLFYHNIFENLLLQIQENYVKTLQERERRKQHMILMKQLEAKKRCDEREKKREEMKNKVDRERERRMEQKRYL